MVDSVDTKELYIHRADYNLYGFLTARGGGSVPITPVMFEGQLQDSVTVRWA